MEVKYHVLYLEPLIHTHIPDLPSKARALIERLIEERLMIDPVGFGKPLRYSFKGHRRLRMSNYRIVYRIEPETNTVIIIAIKHRKDVYGEAS